MRVVNLIIVLDQNKENILMCHRQKDPYKGLYNFVGGKVKEDELHLDAAYRELHEETGISSEDITLQILLCTQYFKSKIELQVYYGILNKEVEVVEEVNPLLWFKVSTDFSQSCFAGDGNIQHFMTTLYEEIGI